MNFKLIYLAGVIMFFPACNFFGDKSDKIEPQTNQVLESSNSNRLEPETYTSEEGQVNDHDFPTMSEPELSSQVVTGDSPNNDDLIVIQSHKDREEELRLKEYLKVHPSIDAKYFDAIIIIAEGNDVCTTEVVSEDELPKEGYMNYSKLPTLLLAPENSLYCDYLPKATLCHFVDTRPVYFQNSEKTLRFQVKDMTHEPQIHFSDFDAICRRPYKIPYK